MLKRLLKAKLVPKWHIHNPGGVFRHSGLNKRKLSVKRRDLMKEDFSPAYKALCKQSTPITQPLFGDSLVEIKCKCCDIPTSFYIPVAEFVIFPTIWGGVLALMH